MASLLGCLLRAANRPAGARGAAPSAAGPPTPGRRGFFIFLFFNFVFYKNIFLFSKFTEIYPGRSAAGRPGPGHPAAGR